MVKNDISLANKAPFFFFFKKMCLQSAPIQCQEKAPDRYKKFESIFLLIYTYHLAFKMFMKGVLKKN